MWKVNFKVVLVKNLAKTKNVSYFIFPSCKPKLNFAAMEGASTNGNVKEAHTKRE